MRYVTNTISQITVNECMPSDLLSNEFITLHHKFINRDTYVYVCTVPFCLWERTCKVRNIRPITAIRLVSSLQQLILYLLYLVTLSMAEQLFLWNDLFLGSNYYNHVRYTLLVFRRRRAEYTVRNVKTTTALFRATTSYMVVPASLLVTVTSY